MRDLTAQKNDSGRYGKMLLKLEMLGSQSSKCARIYKNLVSECCLRFSRRRCRCSSGLWHRVDSKADTNVRGWGSRLCVSPKLLLSTHESTRRYNPVQHRYPVSSSLHDKPNRNIVVAVKKESHLERHETQSHCVLITDQNEYLYCVFLCRYGGKEQGGRSYFTEEHHGAAWKTAYVRNSLAWYVYFLGVFTPLLCCGTQRVWPAFGGGVPSWCVNVWLKLACYKTSSICGPGIKKNCVLPFETESSP